jgi:chemotaxis protein CheX
MALRTAPRGYKRLKRGGRVPIQLDTRANGWEGEHVNATLAARGQHAEAYAVLDELLRDCCSSLMADYGLPATAMADIAGEAATGIAVAAIDFSGRDLRGTIGLRMTSGVVLESYRMAVGAVIRMDSPEATDWTCELVNQLVGRLKNKLRSYQISFNVNSPRLLQIFPVAELERALRRRFVCESGDFAGYLDVMIAPDFTFEVKANDEPLANEGDLVLF